MTSGTDICVPHEVISNNLVISVIKMLNMINIMNTYQHVSIVIKPEWSVTEPAVLVLLILILLKHKGNTNHTKL